MPKPSSARASSDKVALYASVGTELTHYDLDRISRNGTVGDEVPQAALNCGIYAHQARVAPSNSAAILVTRGNDAADGKPEDPGALKLFSYAIDPRSGEPPGGWIKVVQPAGITAS